MFRRTIKRKGRRKKKDLYNPAELRKELIAQARRVFWYYFRPTCLKYHRKTDIKGVKSWMCVGCMAVINEEKNAKVDHIQSVVDTETSERSWDIYYSRLFIKPEATQILCRVCHSAKTKIENERRKQV